MWIHLQKCVLFYCLEDPGGQGAILISGFCLPLILAEAKTSVLCSQHLIPGPLFTSPKKRSGQKANQVDEAQQWFRTGTENVIPSGSCEGHHRRTWRSELTSAHEAPMQVGEVSKSEYYTVAESTLCGTSEW